MEPGATRTESLPRPLSYAAALAAVLFPFLGPGAPALPAAPTPGSGGPATASPAARTSPQEQARAEEARAEEERRADAAHRAAAEEETATEKARRAVATAGALPGAAPPADARQRMPRRTLVDEVLGEQLERQGIPYAGSASDARFLRRATLDATGLIPTPEEVRAFLADDSPDKRARLVDRLVGSEEFAEQWAWFFGDLFRLAHQVGPVRNPFQAWIKEWLTTDRPYDEVVRDLLTGVAKAHGSVPSLAFLARSHQAKSRIVMSPDDYSIHNRLDAIDQFNVDVSRVFLGLNTSCISCHDGAAHLEPLNEWLSERTREEFYRQSAFFGNARLITSWDDRSKNVVVDLLVDDLAKGYDTGDDAPYHTLSEGRFPRLEGLAYEPAFLLTGETPQAGENPRDGLARMLTEHPQFARATVNLVWGKLMTVAFVEPYNSFDLARLGRLAAGEEDLLPSRPVNPELMETLAEDFAANDFSFWHLVKTIMKSEAYGLSPHLSGDWRDEWAGYYPRRYVRVLTGPELVDSLTRATAVPTEFAFSGTTVERVKELTTPSDLGGRRGRGEGAEVDALLQSFFQSNRMTPAPVGNRGSILQALLMMQSGVVNRRVAGEAGGRVAELTASDRDEGAIVDELFLATLGRLPTPAESELGAERIAEDRLAGAEDLQWALLNSPEFLLNH